MRKNVFISYSSKESSIAHMISDVLEKNGISCWIAPECIAPGLDYSEEIPRGIEGCDVFLLLLSESAQASVWVKNELLTAVSAGKVVIPFVISKCDITKAFQFALTSTQRLDAYESMSDNLEKLVKQVKENAGLTEVKEEVAVEHVWGKNDTGESSKTKLPDQDWKELFEIEESDTGVTIHKYIGSESVKEIVIPSEINGKTVRQIGEKAFAGAKIERVIIPDEVEKIEDFVFYDCKNLIEVRLPEDLRIIPLDAFCGCESLSEIELPKNVDWIRCGAFRGCKNLEEIKLPEAVWNIDGEAFRGCESLKQINIPEEVHRIGSGAFQGCASLKQINIPEEVKSLFENTFEGCSHLSVVLYNTRTYKPFYGGLEEFLGEVQLEKAKTLSEKGRNEDAEEWYRAAVRNENVQAQYEVGRICEEKGEWKNAREWYWVAFANGNNGALEGLERTCSKEVKSGNAEALYWLGRTHELKNDMNAAMACYTAAARGCCSLLYFRLYV